MAESAITFEGWRYAHYFEFVRRIDRNVTVRCKLCPGQKLLSTAVNTTSNLNKHLQRTHAKCEGPKGHGGRRTYNYLWGITARPRGNDGHGRHGRRENPTLVTTPSLDGIVD
ncbi:hypothetical protein NQZ68_025939 [Dissostichus eleginoides]|nr:hypothetical protein NQZ68_025939 [Dissostichus eleginoides]